jgi:ubiquinone biosynthesis protein
MIQDLMEIATRNRIRIPPVIFLMIKAFASVEGIARLLDPEFDMVAYAEPYVKRAKLARYSPGKIAEDLFTILSDSLHVLQALPHELLGVTRLIRQNKLTINMEMRGLDVFLRTHDQVTNRLSFSIIIASLIMGSALLLAFNTPPIIYGFSFIGMLGFSAAGFLGIWLLIAILRKGML